MFIETIPTNHWMLVQAGESRDSENRTAGDTNESVAKEAQEGEGWSSSVVPAIILVTSCVALAVVLVVGMVRGRKRPDAHNGSRGSSRSQSRSSSPSADIEAGKMIEMPIR